MKNFKLNPDFELRITPFRRYLLVNTKICEVIEINETAKEIFEMISKHIDTELEIISELLKIYDATDEEISIGVFETIQTFYELKIIQPK